MTKPDAVIDRSESQLAERVGTPPAVQQGGLPAPSMESIIQTAIIEKTDPASLAKLLEVYERMEAIKSKKAFEKAMAAFKAECPPIPRRTPNPQFKVKRNGIDGPRMFASIQDIEETARPFLGRHGLDYRWGDGVVSNGLLTVPCIVSHENGHSERASRTVPVESKAGCSAQQMYGAADSYAMRYSLIAAFGFTSCDEDDDGNAPPGEPISAHQLDNLQSLIADVKMSSEQVGRMLTLMGVTKLEDIRVSQFAVACQSIESKRKKP